MSDFYLNKHETPGTDSRLRRFWPLVTLLVLIFLSSGCMRRRITVRSNPPGALLFVNNQEVGLTPVSFYVTYYGTRDIRLVKDGFKTVVEQHTFRTPWYQIPPLDLISDNFLFREQRDERVLDFSLESMPNINVVDLRNEANALCQRSRQGVIIPLHPGNSPPVPGQAFSPPVVGVPGMGGRPR